MGLTELPQLRLDDLCRRFGLRAPNLMWFLGAGASASAGIATAEDMIWDFKQQLYVSQRRVSMKVVADLSNPEVRAKLQDHVNSCGNLPVAGAADEYARLFETAYPSEADRRTYLDARVAGAKPSYGHLALATMMRAQQTRIIWTTNFDPLVADACAKVYDATGALTTIALDAPDLAEQAINEGRWPVEIKLHGDFRSRRLKAATVELLHQDVRLRKVLVDTCRRFGLVVAGYSGRDDSIMDALEEAIPSPGAFPAGLFWLHRGENQPLTRVKKLLTLAAASGVEASIVMVENFDEALRDLIRLMNGIDTQSLDKFSLERRRWTAAPRPNSATGWPVVRLNALQVTSLPTVCRRIVCNVGGCAEARQAVEQAGLHLLVGRTRAGVLAFGSDADARAAFEPFSITDFSLHTIEPRRLRFDSGERGLLRDALTRAIVRERKVEAIRRRNADLLAPIDPQTSTWAPLKRLIGQLCGIVSKHPELRWREGAAVCLDWADDRLWLVIEPRTVFDGISIENKGAAAAFARERVVKRYNRQLNELIAFWAGFLSGDGGDMRAFGIGDGIDAVFRLSAETGYSRRCRP